MKHKSQIESKENESVKMERQEMEHVKEHTTTRLA